MNFDIENFNAISENAISENKVYIANQSGHDFSPSEKYGKPIYVTKGLINRFSVNYMARAWALSLSESSKKDYILVTSLTILTCIGCAIFGHLHGSINLLIYRNSKYISRSIDFKNLFEAIKDDKENIDDGR